MRFIDILVGGIAFGIGFLIPVGALLWFVSVLP